jgi:uncharacterized membrane protein YraQ (UPF0718 family)
MENMNRELKILGAFLGVFLAAYFMPLSTPKVTGAIIEAFKLLQWYVRNHTLTCVVPALFIAGAVVTFLSKESVMRYLGPASNKMLAYSVASVSGAVLAVCSCSVLPVFAGIYRLGAGLGPACAFLYSGPAINILAIFLTARILGFSIGLGRAVGAVAFAFLIGLLMAAVFRREERLPSQAIAVTPEAPKHRALWKTALFFAAMTGFLVFSDWYNPGNVIVHKSDGARFRAVVMQETRDEIVFQLEEPSGGYEAGARITIPKQALAEVEDVETWVTRIFHLKWYLAALMGLAVLGMVRLWFSRDEVGDWMQNTWEFAKILVPLLFGGVLVVGFVTPFLPPAYVAGFVGSNGWGSNLTASVIGAFWYFATLTEIPITQALMKLGMHSGPVIALLLAGPALSLPNLLVITSVMGWKKTAVFCAAIVTVAAVSGKLFGAFLG